MKKARSIAAIIMAAALSFSCLSIVSAETTVTVNEGATAATVTETVTYPDLTVTAKNFTNTRYAILGTYPEISGYADLNKKIRDALDVAFSLATDKTFTDTANVFSVGYTVTEKGQFAKIDVTYNYALTAGKMKPYSVTDTYYVDKKLKQAITADAYNAGVAAAPAPAADESTSAPAVTPGAETVDNTNEVTMVPVRQYAVALGYTLSWDNDTKSVILTKGDARFTIKVGVNSYLVNNEMVPLESAPTNQNGTVYVPVSFFTKVLGATYYVDTDGNIVIE